MNYKELVLSLLTALLGVLALLFGASAGLTWLTGLCALLYAVFFTLSAIFISEARLAHLVAVLPILPAFFFLPMNVWYYGGIVASLALHMWGRWHMRREATTLPTFSVRRAIRGGLATSLTGIALLTSLLYHAAYKEAAVTSLIPRQSFEIILPYIARSIGLAVEDAPDIDPSMTIDEFLSAYVTKALEKSGIPLEEVPAMDINRLVAEERRLLSKEFGAPLDGDEELGVVLYGAAEKRARDFLGTYVVYVPAILALGIFFALRTLFIPLQWVIMAFVYLLFRAALLSHIIREETLTITIRTYSL